MNSKLRILAIAAALAAGTSGVASAQVCPPGYGWTGATCAPMAAPAPGYAYAPAYAPSNPVSGAAAGGAAGAAAGGAAAGPVGAIVGGAIGTATGAAAGSVNMATGAPVAATPAYGATVPAPAPRCGYGYVYYNGGCYAR